MLDLMGWLGGFMIAGGYIMVSLRRVAPDSAVFQLLNVVGAASLGISCLVEGSLPPACLNAIWFVFGVRSLVVERIRHRRAGNETVSQADFCRPPGRPRRDHRNGGRTSRVYQRPRPQRGVQACTRSRSPIPRWAAQSPAAGVQRLGPGDT